MDGGLGERARTLALVDPGALKDPKGPGEPQTLTPEATQLTTGSVWDSSCGPISGTPKGYSCKMVTDWKEIYAQKD